MAGKKRFSQFIALLAILSVALATSPAQAQLTWDANAATGGQTDGAGAWLGANQWWTGAVNQNWASGSDAVFGWGGAGGAVTLASPTTVNSLTMNSFTGTYTLGTTTQAITLNSGITMNAAAGATTIISPITLGGAQTWLNNSSSLLTVGTGAVTNGGFLLTIDGTANTTVSSVIGGAGGLTKTGAGTLTLSGASTFTGQLTVQRGTLSIATINNVSANGTLGNSDMNLAVILGGSGGQTGTLQYTAASGSSDKTFTLATGGTGAFDVSTALTLSGTINGSGNFTKTGAGTLTLGQTYTNTGIGHASQFTGVTTISGGVITLTVASTGNNALAGSALGLQKSVYDTTGSANSLNVTSSAGITTLWLGGLQGNVALGTAINGYANIVNLNLNPQTGTSASYGVAIANGAANMILNKLGPGTQTLTAANTYSGATNIYAGTLALSGASGSALNSAFTVRGGTLLLDNSGGTFANRIADATALSLGSLTLTSFNGAGIQSETVGATTMAVSGKITINNGTTAGDRTTLALGAVTRSAGAAIDFVGTNGTLGGGANSPNVTSTGAFPGVVNGILPWGTVGGTAWAEDNANSIRAYSGSFFGLAAATNAQNAQLTGTLALGAAAVGNSLNLITSGAGQSLSLGVNNLTLGSAVGSAAAILKSGADDYTISGTGQVRAGSAGAGTELITHVNGGALTISAPLNTAILGIAKGGTGDLILSGTRAATMSGAISIASGGNLEFQGASTTLSGLISGGGGLIANLNPGQTLTLSGTSNTFSGRVLVTGGIFSGGTAFNAQGLSSAPGSGNNGPGTTGNPVSAAGGMNNIEINGGLVSFPYFVGRYLGADPDQIQITGGVSGFTGVKAANAFILGPNVNYEVVWGSDYFKPTTFVLQDATNTAGGFTFNNKIDLNGSTRTIAVNSILASNGATISGIIRDATGGSAGLTKTGVGTLTLSAVNTYSGTTTISGGTLSVSTLANGNSPSGLGNSNNAAANLLLANGTTLQYTGAAASTDRSFTINGTAAGDSVTLDASGSAAVNFTSTASPAYGTGGQTRTLILTGTNANNNTLAANIANNGAGAVSVTKTGAGLWVLSGTSAYTGPTTITAGTLSVSATANLGAAASNLVFNGGTLQVTGGTLTNFSTIGHTVVFNSGQTVGLDIGGTFTADQVLNQGAGGLAKLGVGTLILNQTNTYTGQTTISAGTLQLNDGGTLSSAPLLNNGTFAVNRSTTTTLGTNIPALIGGTGSVTNIGAGTMVLNAPTYYTGTTRATGGNITLSHALAIQNSALDTTGAGTFTLNGVTTPTFGGLSGATGNLATVISNYGSITALTLNPQTGISTYGGVIATNGAMTLTKTGAGTQILQGANTYSGVTNVDLGTLTISGASGSLASTTINLTQGTFNLDNSSTAGGNLGTRISDSATINVNGNSGLGFLHNAGAVNYAETIGTLSLQSGSLTYTGSQAAVANPPS